MAVRRWLGDTLLNAGLVTKQQLDEALAVQNKNGDKLGSVLVALGYISETDLLRTLCVDAGIPFLTEDELQPEDAAVALIPLELARNHTVLPLKLESRHLVLAMADPFDLLTVRTLTRAAGRSIRVVGSPRDAIIRSGAKAYVSTAGAPSAAQQVPNLSVVAGGRPARAGGSTVSADASAAAARFDAARPADAAKSAVGRAGWPSYAPAKATEVVPDDANAAVMVDDIIRRGVDMAATDIHLEPLEDATRVRYRVDGLLTEGPTYPKAVQAALISRIKILSALDIADSRLPQDGRVRIRWAGRNIDLRVSTFPTLHGEDIVLRILDRGRVNLQLEKLGIERDDLLLFRSALQRSHGLIPVTGPTGSGKTTTLYAALLELNTLDRCIITLEDPIEYEIAQLRQSQVNTRAGLTFASGLRSMLRHDPDTILVGEMRDQETVQIALSAALTGHLVLTTLHTTTAAGTIPRLLDMGAEPFVIASAVTMFVSQRLVRTLCNDCKEPLDLPPAVRKRFDLEGGMIMGPRGCGKCRGSGFRGRLGIFEFLPMSPDIVTAIYERTPADQIQAAAGRPTLLQDGLRKVRAGVTTLDEVLRVSA